MAVPGSKQSPWYAGRGRPAPEQPVRPLHPTVAPPPLLQALPDALRVRASDGHATVLLPAAPGEPVSVVTGDVTARVTAVALHETDDGPSLCLDTRGGLGGYYGSPSLWIWGATPFDTLRVAAQVDATRRGGSWADTGLQPEHFSVEMAPDEPAPTTTKATAKATKGRTPLTGGRATMLAVLSFLSGRELGAVARCGRELRLVSAHDALWQPLCVNLRAALAGSSATKCGHCMSVNDAQVLRCGCCHYNLHGRVAKLTDDAFTGEWRANTQTALANANVSWARAPPVRVPVALACAGGPLRLRVRSRLPRHLAELGAPRVEPKLGTPRVESERDDGLVDCDRVVQFRLRPGTRDGDELSLPLAATVRGGQLCHVSVALRVGAPEDVRMAPWGLDTCLSVPCSTLELTGDAPVDVRARAWSGEWVVVRARPAAGALQMARGLGVTCARGALQRQGFTPLAQQSSGREAYERYLRLAGVADGGAAAQLQAQEAAAAQAEAARARAALDEMAARRDARFHGSLLLELTHDLARSAAEARGEPLPPRPHEAGAPPADGLRVVEAESAATLFDDDQDMRLGAAVPTPPEPVAPQPAPFPPTPPHEHRRQPQQQQPLRAAKVSAFGSPEAPVSPTAAQITFGGVAPARDGPAEASAGSPFVPGADGKVTFGTGAAVGVAAGGHGGGFGGGGFGGPARRFGDGVPKRGFGFGARAPAAAAAAAPAPAPAPSTFSFGAPAPAPVPAGALSRGFGGGLVRPNGGDYGRYFGAGGRKRGTFAPGRGVARAPAAAAAPAPAPAPSTFGFGAPAPAPAPAPSTFGFGAGAPAPAPAPAPGTTTFGYGAGSPSAAVVAPASGTFATAAPAGAAAPAAPAPAAPAGFTFGGAPAAAPTAASATVGLTFGGGAGLGRVSRSAEAAVAAAKAANATLAEAAAAAAAAPAPAPATEFRQAPPGDKDT